MTALARATDVSEAAEAVNDALERSTGLTRTAVLLFQEDDMCRFVGWRGLSDEYRRAVEAGRLPASSFPAPGGAVCSWFAIVFLLFVTCLIAYDADSRVCLYVMAGWAAALGIGWAVLKSRNPEVTERRDPEFEKVG